MRRCRSSCRRGRRRLGGSEMPGGGAAGMLWSLASENLSQLLQRGGPRLRGQALHRKLGARRCAGACCRARHSLQQPQAGGWPGRAARAPARARARGAACTAAAAAPPAAVPAARGAGKEPARGGREAARKSGSELQRVGKCGQEPGAEGGTRPAIHPRTAVLASRCMCMAPASMSNPPNRKNKCPPPHSPLGRMT